MSGSSNGLGGVQTRAVRFSDVHIDRQFYYQSPEEDFVREYEKVMGREKPVAQYVNGEIRYKEFTEKTIVMIVIGNKGEIPRPPLWSTQPGTRFRIPGVNDITFQVPHNINPAEMHPDETVPIIAKLADGTIELRHQWRQSSIVEIRTRTRRKT